MINFVRRLFCQKIYRRHKWKFGGMIWGDDRKVGLMCRRCRFKWTTDADNGARLIRRDRRRP